MLASLIVVLHVVSVFWLIAGVVGRNTCYAHARRASDLTVLASQAALASVFDLRFVRPGSLAVLVTGLLAAWARGWPVLGMLQGGAVNWVLAALCLYLSLIPLIVLVLVPKLRVYEHALARAREIGGIITPELRAALADPSVQAARVYELTVTALITVLMITKPF